MSSRAKSDKSAKSSKAAVTRSVKAAKAGKPEPKPAAKASKTVTKVAAKKPAARPAAKSAGKSQPKKPAAAKAARGKVTEVISEQVADVSVEVAAASEAAQEREAPVADTGGALTAQPMLPLPTPPMSEEELELASLYQGDLEAPSLAHGEFKDNKTADEDRPMLPEINARDERRRGWEDRRERRRQEREQRRLSRRDGHRGQPQGGAGGPSRPPHERRDGAQGSQGAQGAPAAQNGGFRGDRGDRGAPPAIAAAPTATALVAAEPAAAELATLGTPMGAATATLYAQLRNGQPLPVRQLAGMLRKRGLIEGDPEQVWPQLRAELLADERAFRAIGLRPRVVHRGRDLFAPGVASMSAVSELEGRLASSVASIQAATARSLQAWMLAASPGAFERLIHSYLVGAGYRELQWVKRVDGIAYAQATAPGLERSVLISARSGSAPIDRRGIGELRVGVEAKGLPFGYLFSAPGLSPEAERELERPGRSIAVLCGDALVATLMSAGIGVASTAVAVRFVDEQFLEDLSVG